mgnify:CR=1 FL=1
MTALIIEDNADCRELLRENLRLCGATSFCERSSLKSALKTLSELSFDVICLDLKLEDATAAETIATLPAIASFAGDAALIVVSGFTKACIPELEKYCGAVIAKPYDFTEFKEGLEKAMRQRRKPVFNVSLLLHCMNAGKSNAA